MPTIVELHLELQSFLEEPLKMIRLDLSRLLPKYKFFNLRLTPSDQHHHQHAEEQHGRESVGTPREIWSEQVLPWKFEDQFGFQERLFPLWIWTKVVLILGDSKHEQELSGAVGCKNSDQSDSIDVAKKVYLSTGTSKWEIGGSLQYRESAQEQHTHAMCST